MITTVSVGHRPNGISFSVREPEPASAAKIALRMPGTASGNESGDHGDMDMDHG